MAQSYTTPPGSKYPAESNSPPNTVQRADDWLADSFSSLVEHARTRWLTLPEAAAFMYRGAKRAVDIIYEAVGPVGPPVRPEAGSLFIVDERRLSNWREDGYDYVAMADSDRARPVAGIRYSDGSIYGSRAAIHRDLGASTAGSLPAGVAGVTDTLTLTFLQPASSPSLAVHPGQAGTGFHAASSLFGSPGGTSAEFLEQTIVLEWALVRGLGSGAVLQRRAIRLPRIGAGAGGASLADRSSAQGLKSPAAQDSGWIWLVHYLADVTPPIYTPEGMPTTLSGGGVPADGHAAPSALVGGSSDSDRQRQQQFESTAQSIRQALDLLHSPPYVAKPVKASAPPSPSAGRAAGKGPGIAKAASAGVAIGEDEILAALREPAAYNDFTRTASAAVLPRAASGNSAFTRPYAVAGAAEADPGRPETSPILLSEGELPQSEIGAYAQHWRDKRIELEGRVAQARALPAGAETRGLARTEGLFSPSRPYELGPSTNGSDGTDAFVAPTPSLPRGVGARRSPSATSPARGREGEGAVDGYKGGKRNHADMYATDTDADESMMLYGGPENVTGGGMNASMLEASGLQHLKALDRAAATAARAKEIAAAAAEATGTSLSLAASSAFVPTVSSYNAPPAPPSQGQAKTTGQAGVPSAEMKARLDALQERRIALAATIRGAAGIAEVSGIRSKGGQGVHLPRSIPEHATVSEQEAEDMEGQEAEISLIPQLAPSKRPPGSTPPRASPRRVGPHGQATGSGSARHDAVSAHVSPARSTGEREAEIAVQHQKLLDMQRAVDAAFDAAEVAVTAPPIAKPDPPPPPPVPAQPKAQKTSLSAPASPTRASLVAERPAAVSRLPPAAPAPEAAASNKVLLPSASSVVNVQPQKDKKERKSRKEKKSKRRGRRSSSPSSDSRSTDSSSSSSSTSSPSTDSSSSSESSRYSRDRRRRDRGRESRSRRRERDREGGRYRHGSRESTRGRREDRHRSSSQRGEKHRYGQRTSSAEGRRRHAQSSSSPGRRGGQAPAPQRDGSVQGRIRERTGVVVRGAGVASQQASGSSRPGPSLPAPGTVISAAAAARGLPLGMGSAAPMAVVNINGQMVQVPLLGQGQGYSGYPSVSMPASLNSSMIGSVAGPSQPVPGPGPAPAAVPAPSAGTAQDALSRLVSQDLQAEATALLAMQAQRVKSVQEQAQGGMYSSMVGRASGLYMGPAAAMGMGMAMGYGRSSMAQGLHAYQQAPPAPYASAGPYGPFPSHGYGHAPAPVPAPPAPAPIPGPYGGPSYGAPIAHSNPYGPGPSDNPYGNPYGGPTAAEAGPYGNPYGGPAVAPPPSSQAPPAVQPQEEYTHGQGEGDGAYGHDQYQPRAHSDLERTRAGAHVQQLQADDHAGGGGGGLGQPGDDDHDVAQAPAVQTAVSPPLPAAARRAAEAKRLREESEAAQGEGVAYPSMDIASGAQGQGQGQGQGQAEEGQMQEQAKPASPAAKPGGRKASGAAPGVVRWASTGNGVVELGGKYAALGSPSVSSKLRALLVGWRVRTIFRLKKTRTLTGSVRDTKKLLSELKCDPSADAVFVSSIQSQLDAAVQELRGLVVEDGGLAGMIQLATLLASRAKARKAAKKPLTAPLLNDAADEEEEAEAAAKGAKRAAGRKSQLKGGALGRAVMSKYSKTTRRESEGGGDGEDEGEGASLEDGGKGGGGTSSASGPAEKPWLKARGKARAGSRASDAEENDSDVLVLDKRPPRPSKAGSDDGVDDVVVVSKPPRPGQRGKGQDASMAEGGTGQDETAASALPPKTRRASGLSAGGDKPQLPDDDEHFGQDLKPSGKWRVVVEVIGAKNLAPALYALGTLAAGPGLKAEVPLDPNALTPATDARDTYAVCYLAKHLHVTGAGAAGRSAGKEAQAEEGSEDKVKVVGKKLQTSVAPKSLSPEWKSRFVFTLPARTGLVTPSNNPFADLHTAMESVEEIADMELTLAGWEVRVDVLDSDRYVRDTAMGQAAVPLDRMPVEHGKRAWITLHAASMHDRVKGQVQLRYRLVPPEHAMRVQVLQEDIQSALDKGEQATGEAGGEPSSARGGQAGGRGRSLSSSIVGGSRARSASAGPGTAGAGESVVEDDDAPFLKRKSRNPKPKAVDWSHVQAKTKSGREESQGPGPAGSQMRPGGQVRMYKMPDYSKVRSKVSAQAGLDSTGSGGVSPPSGSTGYAAGGIGSGGYSTRSRQGEPMYGRGSLVGASVQKNSAASGAGRSGKQVGKGGRELEDDMLGSRYRDYGGRQSMGPNSKLARPGAAGKGGPKAVNAGGYALASSAVEYDREVSRADEGMWMRPGAGGGPGEIQYTSRIPVPTSRLAAAGTLKPSVQAPSLDSGGGGEALPGFGRRPVTAGRGGGMANAPITASLDSDDAPVPGLGLDDLGGLPVPGRFTYPQGGVLQGEGQPQRTRVQDRAARVGGSVIDSVAASIDRFFAGNALDSAGLPSLEGGLTRPASMYQARPTGARGTARGLPADVTDAQGASPRSSGGRESLLSSVSGSSPSSGKPGGYSAMYVAQQAAASAAQQQQHAGKATTPAASKASASASSTTSSIIAPAIKPMTGLAIALPKATASSGGGATSGGDGGGGGLGATTGSALMDSLSPELRALLLNARAAVAAGAPAPGSAARPLIASSAPASGGAGLGGELKAEAARFAEQLRRSVVDK